MQLFQLKSLFINADRVRLDCIDWLRVTISPIGTERPRALFLVLVLILRWFGAITSDMTLVSAIVASLGFFGLGAFKRHVTNLSTVVATDSMFHLFSRVGTVLF